jgi:hypothetical protein
LLSKPNPGTARGFGAVRMRIVSLWCNRGVIVEFIEYLDTDLINRVLLADS